MVDPKCKDQTRKERFGVFALIHDVTNGVQSANTRLPSTVGPTATVVVHAAVVLPLTASSTSIETFTESAVRI